MNEGDDDMSSALSALDELPAPDLWSEIAARVDGSPRVVELQARRPPPGRSHIARGVVAIASAVALVAAGLVLGRTTSPRRPSGPAIAGRATTSWALGQPTEIPGIGPGTLPLMATSAGTVVLARRGGRDVVVVDRDRMVRTVPIAGEVRAVAAGRDENRVAFATILTGDGQLWRVGAAGPAIALADLGTPRSSDPSLAISGGLVFVAGGGSPRLVAVGSTGVVRAVTAEGLRPKLLASHGDDVWALDPPTGRLARVSASTRRVTGTASVRGVSAITAGPRGLYLLRPAAATLMVVDAALKVRHLARVEPLTTAFSADAREVWTSADGVLTAYSTENGRLDGVIVLPSRRYAVLASDDASTSQMNPESGLSRIEQVP